MVKIINGEVMSDSDPRATAHLLQLQLHLQQQQHYLQSTEYQHQLAYAQQQAAINGLNSTPAASPSPSPSPSPPPPSHLPYYQHFYQSQLHNQRISAHLNNQNIQLPTNSTHEAAMPSVYSYSSSPLPHSPSLPSSSSTPTTPLTLTPPLPTPPNSSIPRTSAHYSRRPPSVTSHYQLFGLPDIYVYEICVRPHIYLLAGLIVYLIGPQALIGLVASFFFYRWHLNKIQEEKMKWEREQTMGKTKSRGKQQETLGMSTGMGGPRFGPLSDSVGVGGVNRPVASPFLSASKRTRPASTIHSLHDTPLQS